MSNFIARVELHSADYDDYELLHTSMQRRGFLRRITSNEGRTSQLPTGTYIMENATISGSDALKRAVTAASETGKESSIIVADWSCANWQGLSGV